MNNKRQSPLEYEYHQVKEFVGKDSFHLLYGQLNSVGEQDDGMIKMARNIALKQTIAKIEK